MLTVADVMKMRERNDLDGLIRAMQDPDIAVRAEAVSSLGNLGDPKAVEPLISTLDGDSDPYVRSLAAKSLGEIGDPRAMEPLRRAIKNDTMEVSLEAGKAAAQLGLKPHSEVRDEPSQEEADSTFELRKGKRWQIVFGISLLLLVLGCLIGGITIYGLLSRNTSVEDLPFLLLCSGGSLGLGYFLISRSRRPSGDIDRVTEGKRVETPEKASKVRFLREYTKPIIAGITGTYREYEADSLADARTFLAEQKVNAPRLYLEVHTPEGGLGKDIEGTYEFDV
jgi:hypothetical protein